MDTRVITFANLKGGTAKSTSAAFIVHELHRRGFRVRPVDADPQKSLLDWSDEAEWELPVLGLPSTRLHRQLWGVVDPDAVDVVVIDTPPVEDEQGIVASALRIATDVIVPMAPTMMEFKRIGPVWTAIENAAGLREDDPNTMVLLNRTVANASSTGAFRELLSEDGRRVLAAEVPRREMYAQALGENIPADTHYGAVVDELLGMWGVQQ